MFKVADTLLIVSFCINTNWLFNTLPVSVLMSLPALITVMVFVCANTLTEKKKRIMACAILNMQKIFARLGKEGVSA
jgi:hypothetical protein